MSLLALQSLSLLVPAVPAVEVVRLGQAALIQVLLLELPLQRQAVAGVDAIKPMVYQAVLAEVRAETLVDTLLALELLVKVLAVEMVELLVFMVLVAAAVLVQ
jgi:hypothetical protein